MAWWVGSCLYHWFKIKTLIKFYLLSSPFGLNWFFKFQISAWIMEYLECWKINTRNTEICENWRAGWWVNTKQSRVILVTQASAPQRMLLLRMQDIWYTWRALLSCLLLSVFSEPLCLRGSHSLVSAFEVICCCGLEKQIKIAGARENVSWANTILQREAKNVIWLQGCISTVAIHNFLQHYCCKKLSNFGIFTFFFPLFLKEAYDSLMEEHFLFLILPNQ